MSTSTTAATPTAVPHAALTLLILRLNGLIDRGCSPPLAEVQAAIRGGSVLQYLRDHCDLAVGDFTGPGCTYPGFEAFFEEMDVLAQQGPPDMGRVIILARKYGLEILGPPPG